MCNCIQEIEKTLSEKFNNLKVSINNTSSICEPEGHTKRVMHGNATMDENSKKTTLSVCYKYCPICGLKY